MPDLFINRFNHLLAQTNPLLLIKKIEAKEIQCKSWLMDVSNCLSKLDQLINTLESEYDKQSAPPSEEGLQKKWQEKMNLLELELSTRKEEKELLLKNEELVSSLSKKLLEIKDLLENGSLSSREKSMIRNQASMYIHTINKLTTPPPKIDTLANILSFNSESVPKKPPELPILGDKDHYSDLPELISTVNKDLRILHQMYEIYKFAPNNASWFNTEYNNHLKKLEEDWKKLKKALKSYANLTIFRGIYGNSLQQFNEFDRRIKHPWFFQRQSLVLKPASKKDFIELAKTFLVYQYNQLGQREVVLDNYGHPLNPTKAEWEKALEKYMGNNLEKGKYKKNRNTYNWFKKSGELYTFGNPPSAVAKQAFIKILQQTVCEERKSKEKTQLPSNVTTPITTPSLS